MVYGLKGLFDTVLRLKKERQFALVREAMSGEIALPGKAFLRFDVERALAHHVAIARELAANQVRCTMYFHTRRQTYQPRLLKEIEALGHEVGFHHECLDRCRGDFIAARDLFLREVAMFRRDGFDLRTVCSHGEAGLPKHGYRKNFDLFSRYPALLNEAGLMGEVYSWIATANPVYASDTFTAYKQFWRRIESGRGEPGRPLMILVHPHRWRTNPFATSGEVLRDLFQYAENRITRHRRYDLWPDASAIAALPTTAS